MESMIFCMRSLFLKEIDNEQPIKRGEREGKGEYQPSQSNRILKQRIDERRKKKRNKK